MILQVESLMFNKKILLLQISTQPEYTKWVKPGLTARENTNQNEGSESPRPWDSTQSFDDDLILILSRKKRTEEKPKYLFLTEKDTTVKGEFSEKFKDDREHKDIPRPYQGDRPNVGPKAYSSMGMGMMSATPDRKSGKFCHYPTITGLNFRTP